MGSSSLRVDAVEIDVGVGAGAMETGDLGVLVSA